MKLFRDSEADTYFVLDDDFAFVTIEQLNRISITFNKPKFMSSLLKRKIIKQHNFVVEALACID